MRTLITVGRLLTGDYDNPIDSAALLVDDESGEVLEAGPRDRVLHTLGHDHDYVQLDAPHATALPGLINTHVHLCFTAGADPAGVAEVTDQGLEEVMLSNAMALLEQGITTARDLGDRLGSVRLLRERAADPQSTVLLPRLQIAGPPMTPPQGHCWFLGGEVQHDDNALASQVDVLADMGVDWIKVMVSGGHSTAGGASLWESQFSRHQLATIVNAARRRGLPVAAHAHAIGSVADAVAAGVTTIEHCTLIGSSRLDVQRDEELARSISDAGIAVCIADPHSVDRYEAIIGDRDVAAGLVDRVRFLADHGVALIAGTDAGITPFGDSVESLINDQPTFAPAEVLTTATTTAAQALGLGGHVGRLEAGYSADILIVNGDPLDDLQVLRDVNTVFVRGRRFEARPSAL